MTSDAETRCTEMPKELIEKSRREDETGVQLVDRPFPLPSRRAPVLFHTHSVSPDIDALGYDPFDEQPTLVGEQSWRADMDLSPPKLLNRRRDAWIDERPEAARAVLLESTISIPQDAPRILNAVAVPKR